MFNNIGTKLAALAAFLLAGAFVALRLIGIGEKKANIDMKNKQREIEEKTQKTLKKQQKTTKKRVKYVKDKTDKSDFSSLNDD